VGTALAVAAHELGVRMAPGSRFGVDGAFERFVRLPYSLPEDRLTEVIERLARAWDRVGTQPVRQPVMQPELTEAI
jgi:DNA-binding transcriptional MocR family regulator